MVKTSGEEAGTAITGEREREEPYSVRSEDLRNLLSVFLVGKRELSEDK